MGRSLITGTQGSHSAVAFAPAPVGIAEPRSSAMSKAADRVSSPHLHPHRLRLRRQQLSQHILQDPAVGVVERFLRRIDSNQRAELRRLAVGGGADFYFAAGGEVVDQGADAGDLEYFFAG